MGEAQKEPWTGTVVTPVRLLDERTINQIAAGEVIERPASVVKELVENSLDAGATRVEIRLRDGGKELVSVRDNGHSMERGDLLLAFRKHATSKITSFCDLERVTSFGFRGEALASIASVSRMRALCRPSSATTGTQMQIEGGEVRSVQEAGAPRGTLIEVVDLFYNVPAREKYLKTTPTELKHCLTVLTAMALAHPAVTFLCEHNGRELLNVPATTRERERLGALLGLEVARELVQVTFRNPRLQISGWIGKPALIRKTAGAIHLSINGRPIQARPLHRAIKEAYGNLLPSHHYPVAVLDLSLDPKLVDVNVHPAKLWVRLVDESGVLRSLKEALQAALQKEALIPRLDPTTGGSRPVDGTIIESIPTREDSPEPPEPGNGTPIATGIGTDTGTGTVRPFPMAGEVTPVQSQTQLEVAEPGEMLPAASTLPSMEPVALLDRKYILARDREALYIIDYHAAHERVMYERLRLSHRYAKVASQGLIEPVTVELPAAQGAGLREHIGELEALGFEIEHFGGTSFVVRAVPSLLGGAANKQDLQDILAELADQGRTRTLAQRLEGYLHTVACHSALRAGEDLTRAHQLWLLNEMTTIPNPYACVHGRPSMMAITFQELDRKFKRVGF